MLSAATAGLMLSGCADTYEKLPGMPEGDWQPRDESFKNTTCMMCSAGCGLSARMVDGNLVGIRGNKNHPVNAGTVCQLGVSSIQLQYHPDRLIHPRKRADSGYSKISWEEAENKIFDALTKKNKNIAAVVGGYDSSDLQLWKRLMGNHGGRVLTSKPDDGLDKIMDFMVGSGSNPVADVQNSDCIITAGTNILESGSSPVYSQRAYGELKKNDGHLIHLGPYLNSTAAVADFWLPCQPGTESWILLAFSYMILKEETEESTFIADRTLGSEKLFPFVLANFSPKQASRHTGVPETKILKAGKTLLKAKHPVAMCGQETTWSEDGHIAGWAAMLINALKGQLAKTGGVIPRGELPLKSLADEKNGEVESFFTYMREIKEWKTKKADVILLDKANPLFIYGEDPELVDWLENAETVIAFDMLPGETTKYADFTLPCTTYLEEWSDMEQPSGVPFDAWMVSPPVMSSRKKSRPVSDVILKLLNKSEEGFPFESKKDYLRYKSKGLKSIRRGSMLAEEEEMEQLATMENRGWWLKGYGKNINLENLAQKGGWADLNYLSPNLYDLVERKDGKIQLFPEEITEDLETFAEKESREEKEKFLSLHPFFIAPMNINLSFAFPWMRINAGPLEKKQWNVWAAVNPETAKKYNLKDGERITISGKEGVTRIGIAHFEGIAPGVLGFPMGFGHSGLGRWAEDEPDVNRLLIPTEYNKQLDVPTPVGKKIHRRDIDA